MKHYVVEERTQSGRLVSRHTSTRRNRRNRIARSLRAANQRSSSASRRNRVVSKINPA